MSHSSSVNNPLQRAHALSAQASSLLDSDRPSLQAMNQALQAYREAASLFEASAGDLDADESTKMTLKLLTTQHRKLARDLERRISIAGKGKMAAPVNTRLAEIPPNRRQLSEGSPARGYFPDNKQTVGGMTPLRVDPSKFSVPSSLTELIMFKPRITYQMLERYHHSHIGPLQICPILNQIPPPLSRHPTFSHLYNHLHHLRKRQRNLMYISALPQI